MATTEISAVATMATAECAEELALCLTSLREFHPALPVVVGASSDLLRRIDAEAPHPSGEAWAALVRARQDTAVRFVPCLDQYGSIDRRAMERAAGVWYPSRHTDFMMEKANLMDLALRHGARNALFIDCDVALTAALPQVPADALIGCSPHDIAAEDERLFGRYNGGYVFAAATEATERWRRETMASRYYDQASLEGVMAAYRPGGTAHEFPLQHNFGYWRLLQGPEPAEAVARRFAVTEAGLCYDGAPLGSVHTHFTMATGCRGIPVFNALLRRWLGALPSDAPARRALRLIL